MQTEPTSGIIREDIRIFEQSIQDKLTELATLPATVVGQKKRLGFLVKRSELLKNLSLVVERFLIDQGVSQGVVNKIDRELEVSTLRDSYQ